MSDTQAVQAGWQVIRPVGEVDIANVGELASALDAAAEESPQGFIVDLSSVTYFDSAGIGAILRAYRPVHEAGGKLALVVQTYRIRRLVQALRLEEAPGIVVYDSVEAAAQALTADACH